MEELGGDLAEFGKKATQIMIFLPHYMWAENNKQSGSKGDDFTLVDRKIEKLEYLRRLYPKWARQFTKRSKNLVLKL